MAKLNFTIEFQNETPPIKVDLKDLEYNDTEKSLTFFSNDPTKFKHLKFVLDYYTNDDVWINFVNKIRNILKKKEDRYYSLLVYITNVEKYKQLTLSLDETNKTTLEKEMIAHYTFLKPGDEFIHLCYGVESKYSLVPQPILKTTIFRKPIYASELDLIGRACGKAKSVTGESILSINCTLPTFYIGEYDNTSKELRFNTYEKELHNPSSKELKLSSLTIYPINNNSNLQTIKELKEEYDRIKYLKRMGHLNTIVITFERLNRVSGHYCTYISLYDKDDKERTFYISCYEYPDVNFYYCNDNGDKELKRYVIPIGFMVIPYDHNGSVLPYQSHEKKEKKKDVDIDALLSTLKSKLGSDDDGELKKKIRDVLD